MQAQPQNAAPSSKLWSDLALVVFLIAFNVLVRLVPHAPGLWPFAASALFAGRMLRLPALAIVVPVVAVLVSNLVLPGDDWRITLAVCLAVALPALLGIASRRWHGAVPVIVAMLASSVAFFVVTNFAVWAFGTMYPQTGAGLVACYIAALPFLDKTVFGDLFWCAVLFGGAFAFNRALHSRLARAH
jgi:hypothetical protein